MENEELKNLDEDLPRLKERDLAKAANTYRAKTRVGCDGVHPQVPLDMARETREVMDILENVEQCGKWPQQACTTMLFFLIREHITSERPIALMPTLIRWWEALREPEVATWQYKYRIEWEATDGRNGGSQRMVWEMLLEMERLKKPGRRKISRSGSPGFGSGESYREGQSSSGVGLGDAFQFSQRDVAGAMRVR